MIRAKFLAPTNHHRAPNWWPNKSRVTYIKSRNERVKRRTSLVAPTSDISSRHSPSYTTRTVAILFLNISRPVDPVVSVCVVCPKKLRGRGHRVYFFVLLWCWCEFTFALIAVCFAMLATFLCANYIDGDVYVCVCSLWGNMMRTCIMQIGVFLSIYTYICCARYTVKKRLGHRHRAPYIATHISRNTALETDLICINLRSRCECGI